MIKYISFLSHSVYGMSEALIITIVPGPQHNIPGTVPAGSTGVVAPDCKVKVGFIFKKTCQRVQLS